MVLRVLVEEKKCCAARFGVGSVDEVKEGQLQEIMGKLTEKPRHHPRVTG